MSEEKRECCPQAPGRRREIQRFLLLLYMFLVSDGGLTAGLEKVMEVLNWSAKGTRCSIWHTPLVPVVFGFQLLDFSIAKHQVNDLPT
jgi:hypothetical protein